MSAHGYRDPDRRAGPSWWTASNHSDQLVYRRLHCGGEIGIRVSANHRIQQGSSSLHERHGVGCTCHSEESQCASAAPRRADGNLPILQFVQQLVIGRFVAESAGHACGMKAADL